MFLPAQLKLSLKSEGGCRQSIFDFSTPDKIWLVVETPSGKGLLDGENRRERFVFY